MIDDYIRVTLFFVSQRPSSTIVYDRVASTAPDRNVSSAGSRSYGLPICFISPPNKVYLRAMKRTQKCIGAGSSSCGSLYSPGRAALLIERLETL